MRSKIILFSINILSVYCVVQNESPICPTDRIDAMTNLSNGTLITIKGKYVWTSKNKRIEKIGTIWEKWPQLPQHFHNNINALIFDEKEGVSLIFKDQFFTIITESRISSSKELGTYFPEIVKVDVALLLTHKRQECWQQFGCQTLYLFEGHFLWSFDWFHFWHINSRSEEKSIDLKTINVNFPDKLDAAFAQNNFIYLIKDNFFFRIPIYRFPFEISNQDLKRESFFDQIIRCEFNNYLNRRQLIDEPVAAPSQHQATILKESVQTIDSTSSHKNKTFESINQNETNIEINSSIEVSTISPLLPETTIENNDNQTKDSSKVLSDFEQNITNTTDLQLNKSLLNEKKEVIDSQTTAPNITLNINDIEINSSNDNILEVISSQSLSEKTTNWSTVSSKEQNVTNSSNENQTKENISLETTVSQNSVQNESYSEDNDSETILSTQAMIQNNENQTIIDSFNESSLSEESASFGTTLGTTFETILETTPATTLETTLFEGTFESLKQNENQIQINSSNNSQNLYSTEVVKGLENNNRVKEESLSILVRYSKVTFIALAIIVAILLIIGAVIGVKYWNKRSGYYNLSNDLSNQLDD